MNKFHNRYRIPSARLQSWNYGWDGSYFISICTQGRECCFGNIKQNEIQYTALGEQAHQCALAIPKHFPFVILDEFVIMPNHVHLLFTIHKTNTVETQDFASLPPQTQSPKQNRFGPQSKNVASIIRGFKIGVTKYARNNNIAFKWQPRFHDHIVRNTQEYERIRYYIQSNVENWNNDSLK